MMGGIKDSYGKAGVRFQASGFRRQASGFRRQASGVRLWASGVRLTTYDPSHGFRSWRQTHTV